jgi:uncharacterized membrane protein
MLSKHLEKRKRVLMLLGLDSVSEKTCRLVVRVVNFKGNEPITKVNVKVFRLEKEAISPQQWAENLKNGAPFKRLILSADSDNKGTVTAELPEGDYEAKVEKYGLSEIRKVTENAEVVFVEPKKHWWSNT